MKVIKTFLPKVSLHLVLRIIENYNDAIYSF